MIALPPLPESYPSTRDALQRVAVHVLARAAVQRGGRIDLRVAPSGFATPEIGDGVRLRVAGTMLVREVTDHEYRTTYEATPIDGSTLAELARAARVDLGAELDVGHDTPPLGDVDEVVVVDGAATDALGAWYLAHAVALDRVAATFARADGNASPTAIRLWPEHFDVAMDLEAAAGERVNLGGSPGDGFHAAPYSYVGPWTDARPGDGAFWNAPFGAVLSYDEVADARDAVDAIASFLLAGVGRFDG